MPRKNTEYNYTFVNQSVTALNKVREYIETGMDTTLSVSHDTVDESMDSDGARGEALIVEMRGIMNEFCQMEKQVNAVLNAVTFTKAEVANTHDQNGLDISEMFDAKLKELQEEESDLENHRKVREFNKQIEDILSQTGESDTLPPPGTMTGTVGDGGDSDIEMEVAQVNLKCPVTGKEMTDPVRNVHCTHNYERKGIQHHMKQKGHRAKCPVSGCINNRPIEQSHLEDNRELKRWIDRKNRKTGKSKRR